MLAEGGRLADESALPNVRWVRALAEQLPAIAPGPYRLVTFGQSFHWTDGARDAEVVYDMLQPDGAMALIVHTVDGRPRPPGPGAPQIPHDDIKAPVSKYLGSTPRARSGHGTRPDPPLRGRPCPYAIRCPSAAVRARYPRSAARHRHRAVRLLLAVHPAPHCSATGPKTSRATCESSSHHGRPQASSGIGPETPQ
jgi:hypothetical protein